MYFVTQCFSVFLTSKENEVLKDKIRILQDPDNQVIKLSEAQDLVGYENLRIVLKSFKDQY